VLRFLDRRPRIDAATVTGNVLLGNVHGDVVQNFINGIGHAREPVLRWLKLPSTEDEPNLSLLLSWQTRLVRLLGRDEPRSALLQWARRGEPIRIRLLSGPGGAGKSRLAAEVADELCQEGWTAGFAPPNLSAILPLRDKGLFLIVDYPEERRNETRLLLQDAATMNSPPAPIRILLLSRQPAAWWQGDIDAAHADLVCDAQEVGVARLDEATAVSLFQEATRRLAQHLRRDVPEVLVSDVRRWLDRDPAMHGLPLFVIAAAIHLGRVVN
jgi:hypothetical protein